MTEPLENLSKDEQRKRAKHDLQVQLERPPTDEELDFFAEQVAEAVRKGVHIKAAWLMSRPVLWTGLGPAPDDHFLKRKGATGTTSGAAGMPPPPPAAGRAAPAQPPIAPAPISSGKKFPTAWVVALGVVALVGGGLTYFKPWERFGGPPVAKAPAPAPAPAIAKAPAPAPVASAAAPAPASAAAPAPAAVASAAAPAASAPAQAAAPVAPQPVQQAAVPGMSASQAQAMVDQLQKLGERMGKIEAGKQAGTPSSGERRQDARRREAPREQYQQGSQWAAQPLAPAPVLVQAPTIAGPAQSRMTAQQLLNEFAQGCATDGRIAIQASDGSRVDCKTR